MTLEERIEAAAQGCLHVAWYSRNLPGQPPDLASMSEGEQAANRAVARSILAAAFPELFTSPPTMWLAPMEASEEMIDTAMLAFAAWSIPPKRVRIGVEFAAARDAHLNREGK